MREARTHVSQVQSVQQAPHFTVTHAARESAHLEGRGGVCVPALALATTPSAQQGQAHLPAVVQVGVEAHRPASYKQVSRLMNKHGDRYANHIHGSHQTCTAHQAKHLHACCHPRRSGRQCPQSYLPLRRSYTFDARVLWHNVRSRWLTCCAEVDVRRHGRVGGREVEVEHKAAVLVWGVGRTCNNIFPLRGSDHTCMHITCLPVPQFFYFVVKSGR